MPLSSAADELDAAEARCNVPNACANVAEEAPDDEDDVATIPGGAAEFWQIGGAFEVSNSR